MEAKKIKPLTESDSGNLSHCPDGKWFDEMDVWPRVKRPRYSLDRLVAAGYLESKTTAGMTGMKYKVIKRPETIGNNNKNK